MDESAIRLIQQTAIGDYNGKQERLAGTGVIALPDNFKLHNLEGYQLGRRRFRGVLTTNSVTEFVSYVKRHQGKEGFVDAENLSARVFFNLGDKEAPGHGDWQATLKLKATAAYAAVLAVADKQLTQKALIDWLEDWNGFVVPGLFGNDGGSLGHATTAIRKITTKAKSEVDSEQGDFKNSRSRLDSVEVEAAGGLRLPEGFTFKTEPYQGLPSRDFYLRLSARTSGDAPALVLRIVRKEEVDEQIATDFKRVLLDGLEGHTTLTIGTFNP